MKLAFKLILATVIGILGVFAVYGVVRAQREVALFDFDMRKDHRLIGSTLGLCVANTWSNAGVERALELVAQSDAARPDLRIGWLFADGSHSSRAPVFSSPENRELHQIDHLIRTSAEPPYQSFLVTRIPVRQGAKFLGVIEIAENLSTRDAYFRTNVWNTLFATITIVFVAGLVILFLGVWLVGRPLQAVTDKARRIGRGDLSGALCLRQNDEIGQLASEIDAMCDRLRESNERSEAESTAKLHAVEQLRHADRLITVGRLAAGIAHELGTPLNIITGRLKMLRRGNTEPAKAEEYLSEVAGQVDMMTAIIRQLVNFARRREPKAIATDLLTVARGITKLVEPLAKKRGVTVSVVTNEAVLAFVDPMQIEQVLSNLVINAIHACNEGGQVAIAFGNRTSDTTATPLPPGIGVFLRVSDNGQGMDAATMEQVFEPFFTTKDIGQGTGLGLSVAHGIVQDHGGHISVTSSPEQGSVFTVLLPAVRS